ncbi:MAG: hypothetical protein GY759_21920 [Chloroflexi bacterium]|nr:hypothetical protein [Chloroflexota bacterium]
MPTLEVTISETTYSSLKEKADEHDRPIESVVQDALHTFLQTSSSNVNKPVSGSDQKRGRQAKIHVEAELWRTLPEEIRHSYGNVFVAVHKGEVVDHDLDRLLLYRRIRAQFGDIPVLITPAQAPSPRTFQVISPRSERLP